MGRRGSMGANGLRYGLPHQFKGIYPSLGVRKKGRRDGEEGEENKEGKKNKTSEENYQDHDLYKRKRRKAAISFTTVGLVSSVIGSSVRSRGADNSSTNAIVTTHHIHILPKLHTTTYYHHEQRHRRDLSDSNQWPGHRCTWWTCRSVCNEH